MDTNKDENEKNNERQEEIIEQTAENKLEENNNEEVVSKKENDVQENIQTEVENNEKIVQEENSNEFSKKEESIQVESEGNMVKNEGTEQKENADETAKKDNNFEGENNQTKTKSINLWLFLIPIILVVLVLIYIFTDVLKTDEQNFSKYMYITSKNIENLKSDELEKYFDKTKYTSNGEISLITEGQEDKVQFTGKTDVENRLKETNITTDYGEEELEINYKQDNNIYAIEIDKLYDKYLAIENNNLKELASALGLESDKIPNRIELEKCKFTEEELEDIKKKYTKIIKNEITKENYSSEKKDNNNIYKLSLTNKQLNIIKIKMLQELKNDNLILEKYVIYEKINGNKIEKEDLQKEIESKVKELQKNTFEQEKTALVISLYAKLNKCNKIEIKSLEETIMIEIDKNYLKIISQRGNKEENEFSFEIQKEEIAQELKYNIEIEGQNYNFDINLKYSDLLKNTVKEEYNVDLKNNNDNMNLKYINTTSQDNRLVINKLDDRECEILNNLNKNEINELIYKIYNNLVSL